VNGLFVLVKVTGQIPAIFSKIVSGIGHSGEAKIGIARPVPNPISTNLGLVRLPQTKSNSSLAKFVSERACRPL
jgi:hypothetical protein